MEKCDFLDAGSVTRLDILFNHVERLVFLKKLFKKIKIEWFCLVGSFEQIWKEKNDHKTFKTGDLVR